MKQQKSIHFAVAVLAVIGLAGMPLSARSIQGSMAGTCHKTSANRLFKNLEEQSYNLQDHAETLRNSTAAEQMDYQFYDEELTAVKHDVNMMGREFPKLINRTSESPAERQVAERLRPQLASIASTVSSAIQYVNAHQDELQTAQMRNLTDTLSTQTQSLWQMLHDAVRLTDLHAETHQVRKDLARSENRG